MYNEHFGLRSAPFKITPDTRLFYTGGSRGEILQALVYAITSGEGIIKVVGEVGTGKTMLCRMLEVKLPENVEIVYLANPSLSPDDILHAIALEMAIDVDPGANRLQVLHVLQQRLLERHASNRHVVVLVEEAQSMPNSTLEEIRLLSNLETQQEKLLQIVMFGQPELNEKLLDPAIRQLRERITHSFELEPFAREDIREYVNFRLRQVGHRGRGAFQDGAFASMYRASRGLTRRVNILADKALLAAYAEDTHDVSRRHVRIAIGDSEFDSRRRWGWPEFALGSGVLMVTATLSWIIFVGESPFSGPLISLWQRESVAAETTPPPSSATTTHVTAATPVAEAATSIGRVETVDAGSYESDAAPAETEPDPMTSTVELVPAEMVDSTPVVAEPVVDEVVVPTSGEPRLAMLDATAPAATTAPQGPVAPATRPDPPPSLSGETIELTVELETPTPVVAPAPVEPDAVIVTAAATPVAVTTAMDPTPPPPERTGQFPLVEQRLLATARWLQSADSSHYSIQLLLTDVGRRQNLEDFLRERELAGELEHVYVYETVINNRSWYGVLYREYPSFTAARRALEKLPASLSRHQPFIRNVRDVAALG